MLLTTIRIDRSRSVKLLQNDVEWWEMRSRPCETSLEDVASATDVGAWKTGRTSQQ
jgi:hypothetical protein